MNQQPVPASSNRLGYRDKPEEQIQLFLFERKEQNTIAMQLAAITKQG
jgi:hypothetical protein